MDAADQRALRTHLTLQCIALGQRPSGGWADADVVAAAGDVLARLRARRSGTTAGVDARTQAFLRAVLGGEAPTLPDEPIELDRPGLAALLALPPGRDEYANPFLDSWRVRQGVLHNPASDRRTTAGTFHVAEHGPSIPGDKRALPVVAFARLLARALAPPAELLGAPLDPSVRAMVALYLRPTVVPAVGDAPARRMEVRCLAPAGLVAGLDFLERVFGNGGDAWSARCDAGHDVEWSGHTGCIVFAPHVVGVAKRALGLPHRDQATERQRRDGMCWSAEDEPYHGGKPFKATLRDEAGVIVTILADSYFGYGKKEVKTMVSFAANLGGQAEEEHAGGAWCFPRYHLGQRFSGDQSSIASGGHRFADALAALGDRAQSRPEGYAVDTRFPDVLYVPEDVVIDHGARTVGWGGRPVLKLRAGITYVHPSGYRVDEERHPAGGLWRLTGTSADGVLIHRPATVSGGGKSELAKPIDGALLYAPVYVGELEADLDAAAAVIHRDFADRHREARPRTAPSRPVLGPQRSLGSVIKLLTPSPDFTDAYNAWLVAIPDRVRALVFLIKRLWRPAWGDAWRAHFTVDLVNGVPGHELKCDQRKLVGSYLRVGHGDDGAWRTFKLRQDFVPAAKVQVEDDITASTVVPAAAVGLGGGSVKLVENLERMLFQRPDDAIQPGADRVAERDLAGDEVFCSNYEPLDGAAVRALAEDPALVDRYSDPMRRLLVAAAAQPDGRTVISSQPRLIGGKPSTNPRYLQPRPDVVDARGTWLAEISRRLATRWPSERPLPRAVDAVLIGRRNNPPDRAQGIPQLALYNPLHWQEPPELVIDLATSLSGASPSTTGAGSEGALTKAPFNALPPVHDLNAAVVAFALTGLAGFSSPAGHVGPRMRVDHDLTQLMPELLCRLTPAERDPAFLVAHGYLERVADVVRDPPETARLGWRITAKFVAHFLGRVFDSPRAALDELLRPEGQDPDAFADGVRALAAAQRRVCAGYIADGSIASACPPLATALRRVAEAGSLDDPELRSAFAREHVLASDWYRARLAAQRAHEARFWGRRALELRSLGADPVACETADRRAEEARADRDGSALVGRIGLDPQLLRVTRAAKLEPASTGSAITAPQP